MELLFVVSAGAGGGAGVGRMAAQFDVNGLPQFVGHGRFVAARSLHFGEEHEQIQLFESETG